MSFLHTDTHPEHWLPRCNKLISMLKKEFNTIYPFNNYSKTIGMVDIQKMFIMEAIPGLFVLWLS